MVKDNLTCRFINSLISKIRSIYRWAVSDELIPGEVIHAISSVKALEPGEEGVRDKPKVADVPEQVVEMTLPYSPAMPRAIVKLLLLTGARCGEMCILRPCDIDRTNSDAWIYQPSRHKTMKKQKDRFIYFGPAAQAILSPWLIGVEPNTYVFSPKRGGTPEYRSIREPEDEEVAEPPEEECEQAEGEAW